MEQNLFWEIATSMVTQRVQREWKRGTKLVSLFVATGAVKDIRPASLLLVGEPGLGKTELLEKFRVNSTLSYHSDLTVRGFWKILRKIDKGRLNTTHLCFGEFQKLFLRKTATWENCVGTLAQAMEEGVVEIDVGPEHQVFNSVRIGIIGGMTLRSLVTRAIDLDEIGVLSRVCVLPWVLPEAELENIMNRIRKGITTDLKPVKLQLPPHPVRVTFRESLARPLQKYVWDRHRVVALRLFKRLRGLAQAHALLKRRRHVTNEDVTAILSFTDYWDRLVDTASEARDV